ncbi:glycosyltransferase family 4 protein [uncultured Algibacter sp.]|uniref:glycosyltransferase family 4 protein n=1 Tax=uncultured Algibacter sp. TaxID=298659 RepID=UPI00263203CF|nr:glycosyltransferase family 4 protein [uncultured Algibacter sp.]
MKKKVLIITYYWPPAGGPGVQRWLKFVKYLPEFDVEPIVFIPENPNYPLIDESLVLEVSNELNVIKHPIKEPYKWASILSKKSSNTISKGVISDLKKQSLIERLMLYVRGNFFIPDARIGWIKPSISYLSGFIKKEGVQAIITTGPPHSVHLIGLGLKEKFNLRWLADFRDPWTTIGYHKQLKLSKSSVKKHKAFEEQVLNFADQIIVTSSNTKKGFQERTNKPIEVITNGYDNESVTDFAIDSKFTISHIGSLLSKRNPKNLWKAISELIVEDPQFEKDFLLRFVGVVGESVLDSLRDFNLSDCVDNVGYVSHKESIAYQKKSQLLLLIEIDSNDTKSIIPGKLFEYMVSGRPIIGIGPKDTDVENILIETNTGNYFNYDDYESLKSTILEHYKAFKSGNLQAYPIGLQKYHRKALTKSLSKLL